MLPEPTKLPGMPPPSESSLQEFVVSQLRLYLPDAMVGFWSATLNGIPLPSAGLRAKAKRQGLERGPGDLMFLWPDGVTTFIELKKDHLQRLRPEQAAWGERLGPDRFARCDTWLEVKAVLDARLALYGLRWNTDAEAARRALALNAAKTKTRKATRNGNQPNRRVGRRTAR